MEVKRFAMPFEIKADSIKEDEEFGYFSGYGSVYGNIDQGDDIVEAGAFTESLKTRTPKMLWQHQFSNPIGIYTRVTEDAKGLYLEGKIFRKVLPFGENAYQLLKGGAISGLSVGYSTSDCQYEEMGGSHVRRITKADLYEVSIVTEPMNEAAHVISVKSIEEIASLADVEELLRGAGLSKKAGTALVSKIKEFVRQRDAADNAAEIKRREAEGIEAEIMQSLSQITNLLKG